MKRQIGVAMLAAVTAVAGFAPSARAQCTTGMMFAWGENAYAYESNYNAATFISSNGSSLNVVGVLTAACQMFSGLDPSDPTKEYTFLLTNLTSAGTSGPTVIAGNTRWTTNYSGGNFFIYEGSPRNAPGPNAAAMPPSPPNADVPSKYTDGPVILTGTLSNFSTLVVRQTTGNYANSFRANYVFTGGTMFALVGPESGLLQGTWEANDDGDPGKIGLLDLPAGYSAHPIGKFDQPVTPAQSSTWGAIKQLYR